ncbi:hypothetical protein IAR50_004137 [Cryptococcus sp. DSM 104548]
MSKMNLWVVPAFVVGIVTQMTSCVLTVFHGYQLPQMDNSSLVGGLVHWQKKLAKLSTIWGSITLCVDACICLFMIFILSKSRNSTFHKEIRIFTRVVSLTFETMFPPVIILIVLLNPHGKSSTPLSDIRQALICALPPLCYHSALHTLVDRRYVGRILDPILAAGVVQMLSGGRLYGGPGSRYHLESRDKGGVDDPFVHGGEVEMNADGVSPGMMMFGGKGKMWMTPPMVRVETNIIISEPDRLFEQKSSVNRDWIDDDLNDISESNTTIDVKLEEGHMEHPMSVEMIAPSCGDEDLVLSAHGHSSLEVELSSRIASEPHAR